MRKMMKGNTTRFLLGFCVAYAISNFSVLTGFFFSWVTPQWSPTSQPPPHAFDKLQPSHHHAPKDSFSSPPYSSRVFTPELSSFVNDLMRKWDVPGISLAVVNLSGSAEFQGFGISTEDGDPVTAEVSAFDSLLRILIWGGE